MERVKYIMIKEVEACANKQENTTDEYQKVHYSRIGLPQETPVEYGIQDCNFYELPNPFGGLVKAFIRLAQHPHLVSPVNHITD
jgi:hypothetical protein